MLWKLNSANGFTWDSSTIDPNFPSQNVTFTYYQRMNVYSICEKRGSYVSIITTSCADKPLLLYQLLEEDTRSVFGGVGSRLGAVHFDGTCPRKLTRDSLEIRSDGFGSCWSRVKVKLLLS
jgi:hypothetical protein